MIGKFRKKIKPFSMMLAKPFALLGIHPNIVSMLAIPLSVLAVYFILIDNAITGFVFALLAVSMDLIDGSVAELTKKKTNFGNYFETMIDKYVEVILLLPLLVIFPLQTFLALGFGLIESYAKPRAALVVVADNKDWPAIGEHAERIILILASIGVLIFHPNLDLALYYSSLIMWLLVIITFVGGIQRIFYARNLIHNAEKSGKILPYLKIKKTRRKKK